MLLILILLMPGISACSGEGQPEQAEEQAEVLVLAAFDESSYLRKQVELYNAAQSDYNIMITQYER